MKSSVTRVAALSVIFAAIVPHASCATNRPTARENGGPAPRSFFDFNLYREIVKERPGENVFVSPASVGFALAMTSGGARGATREDIGEVLGRSDTSAAARSDSLLMGALNAPMRGIELTVANSIWARRGLDFKRDFLARNERFYGAEVRSIDFASPRAAAEINAWVARKTKEKITEIVHQIDESSILFLIDAIYFKGSWTNAFDRTATRDDTFYAPRGTRVMCPMMRRGGVYLYCKGDGFQAASIPYGDGRVSMYLFLPDERSGLDEFQAKLSAENWDAWMKGCTETKGLVALPRFKLEFETKLKTALTRLGMGIAFDASRSDFKGMIEQPDANAFLDDVVHKTFVEVNEEGTEAAAATSAAVRLTSVIVPEKPFEMICDHPFFFMIRDNESGLVLFMGSIVRPE